MMVSQADDPPAGAEFERKDLVVHPGVGNRIAVEVGNDRPSGVTQSASGKMHAAPVAMGEIDRLERGDRAGFQIEKRDFVRIDILIHQHFTAFGVERGIGMAGNAQQPAAGAQVAVVDHQAAGVRIRPQRAGFAAFVHEG